MQTAFPMDTWREQTVFDISSPSPAYPTLVHFSLDSYKQYTGIPVVDSTPLNTPHGLHVLNFNNFHRPCCANLLLESNIWLWLRWLLSTVVMQFMTCVSRRPGREEFSASVWDRCHPSNVSNFGNS